jgi:hypothetical protein
MPPAVVSTALILLLSACGSDDHSAPHTDQLSGSPTPTSRATAIAVALGSPPRIPWWSHGRLHVEEGVIRTPLRQVVARGGTVIFGRATQQGSHWVIQREVNAVGLLSSTSSRVHPVLSANGLHAAWTTSVATHRDDPYEADTAFTITAYDVGRDRVVGSTVLESHTQCCDAGGVIEVANVDNDGSVVIGRYADRAWIWRPGHAPARLTGDVRPRGISGNDQWPDGVSWTTGDGSDDPAAFGWVTPDGVVTRVGRVPQSQGGLWSPHGTSYAYPPVHTERKTEPVVWRDGGHRVLQAPRGAWPIAWESERRVLLVDGDLDASIGLVRCWVGDGRCEPAGPPLRRARLPDMSGF